jgi:hypothetical protein
MPSGMAYVRITRDYGHASECWDGGIMWRTDATYGPTTSLKSNCGENYGLTYRELDGVAVPRRTKCVKKHLFESCFCYWV